MIDTSLLALVSWAWVAGMVALAALLGWLVWQLLKLGRAP